MLWVIVGLVIGLSCFLMGLAFANRIAEEKLNEKRSEMQLDCEEPNIWMDGIWYTETELENKFHEMQLEIKELEKTVEIYRTMVNNAMLGKE